MKRTFIFVCVAFVLLFLLGGTLGFILGKHASDRWYAQHQPVAATPQSIDFEGSTSCIATELTFPASVNRDGTIRTWGTVHELPRSFWGGVDGHRFEYIPAENGNCILFREDSDDHKILPCPKHTP